MCCLIRKFSFVLMLCNAMVVQLSFGWNFSSRSLILAVCELSRPESMKSFMSVVGL